MVNSVSPVLADASEFPTDPCRGGYATLARAAGAEKAPASDVRQLANGTLRRTTYLPNAAYSVMECAPTGEFKRQVSYELRATPSGESYLPITSVYPAKGSIEVATAEWPTASDTRWATIWSKGRTRTESARMPPNSAARLTTHRTVAAASRRGSARARASSGSVNYQCSNSHYNLIADPATFMRMSAWPTHGFPVYTAMPSTLFRDQALNGYTAWDGAWNACGFGDGDWTQSWWAGDVGGWSNVADGLNVMGGWSNPGMACGSVTSGVLACSFSHGSWLSVAGPGGQNFRISDTDTFFNFAYCYTVGSIPGCYDVRSVSTHEAGHAYGLQHVGCCNDDYDDDIVMYPFTYDGDLTHRTLALGDIYGLGQFYPY